jgi:hypothetical protein
MQLSVLLAADYANLAMGGKLNVMGVFAEIHAQQFPTRNPSMYLVVKLIADLGEIPEKRKMMVKLLDEDGAEVVSFSQDFEFPEARRGRRPEVNMLMELKDLIFEKPGTYEFVVLVDNDQKGTLPIHVRQLNPQEG